MKSSLLSLQKTEFMFFDLLVACKKQNQIHVLSSFQLEKKIKSPEHFQLAKNYFHAF